MLTSVMNGPFVDMRPGSMKVPLFLAISEVRFVQLSSTYDDSILNVRFPCERLVTGTPKSDEYVGVKLSGMCFHPLSS